MSGSNAVPHPLPSKVPHAKPDLLIAVKRRSWSCGVAIAPSFFTVGILNYIFVASTSIPEILYHFHREREKSW